jgi:anaerobic magnesium-protoporphyrin IX monomethyl ester cyclase
MSATDCLILGFYDYPFDDFVAMMRAMGEESGAYRDLALAFVEHEGRPQRALDILTRFFYEGRPAPERPFNNADFLWPVVTYLTTYLRRRGFAVDHVNLPHFETAALRGKLAGDVRTVAITTTLYVSPHPILDLVALVRRYNSTARIVVGGPYVSGQAKTLARDDLSRLLLYLGADVYVLCQEGEATLAAVLEALRQGRPLAGVPNLALVAGEQVEYTPPAAESNSLLENMVDYGLFAPADLGGFVTTRTAKSCPFACAFCGFPERAGDYNYLAVAEVEKEFDAIRALGAVGTVTIIDDTYNVPKGRFKDILRMMIRNRYEFKWNCFYRADQGDAEAIELMAAAGCEGVFLGIESGSDAMLKRMNKRTRREQYRRAIPLLHAAGISTYASLIVGFPGETDETVGETISLIEEARPEFYRAQLWYADPLTPIWRERERYGITGMGFSWAHDTMDAQRACAWIDTMFLQVEGSTWLPQFGFEQWSTFYLQRHGMSREQIGVFLRSFNAVIKHRLVGQGEATPAELIDNLRASCQFDRPANAAARAPEPWSGRAYGTAGEVLAAELAGCEPPAAAGGPAAAPGDLAVAAVHQCRLPAPDAAGRPAGAAGGLAAGAAELVLAAYAAVAALDGGGRTLLAQPGPLATDLPVPWRARTPLSAPFAHWVAEAGRRLAALLPHRRWALAICANPVWRDRHRLPPLAFPQAFVFAAAGEEGAALPGAPGSPSWPSLPVWIDASVRRGLSEVLEASWTGGLLTLRLHQAGAAPPEPARRRLQRVARLLELAASDPASRPADLGGDGCDDEAGPGPSVADSDEVFAF